MCQRKHPQMVKHPNDAKEGTSTPAKPPAEEVLPSKDDTDPSSMTEGNHDDIEILYLRNEEEEQVFIYHHCFDTILQGTMLLGHYRKFQPSISVHESVQSTRAWHCLD